MIDILKPLEYVSQEYITNMGRIGINPTESFVLLGTSMLTGIHYFGKYLNRKEMEKKDIERMKPWKNLLDIILMDINSLENIPK